MDKDKLTQNSILFGIMCNFPQHCGEERAKEARDYIEKTFAELERYRAAERSGELVRVVRCKDCVHGELMGKSGCACHDKTLRYLHSGKKYCSEGERREV